MSINVRNIMERCWNPLSALRPTAKEIFEILSHEEILMKLRESRRSSILKSISSLFASKDSI